MSADASKAGARLRSAVSDVEVVVVRPPTEPLVVACGGEPMLALDDPRATGATFTGDDVTALGKRYVDEDSGLELLCTKGGAGAVTANGRDLTIKGAKPLPSSD
jgi:hypothetical protein